MTAASSALGRQRGEGRSSAENTTRLTVPLERLGFWSAALAAVFTVLWTVAAVVTVVASPPASWAGIDAYAASFNSRQMLMLVPVLLLAPTFVVVMDRFRYPAPALVLRSRGHGTDRRASCGERGTS